MIDKNKIMQVYALCDIQEIEEGKIWYNVAHNWAKNLAEVYNVKIQTVAALAAVFSPLKSWDLNKKLVEEFLECRTCGHFSTQILKAHAIMGIDGLVNNIKELDKQLLNIIHGDKTKNFYLSIAYPENDFSVCIDVHMLKLIDNYSKSFKGAAYNAYAKVLIESAKSLNILPLQLQAILWVHIKNNDSIYNPNKKTKKFDKNEISKRII